MHTYTQACMVRGSPPHPISCSDPASSAAPFSACGSHKPLLQSPDAAERAAAPALHWQGMVEMYAIWDVASLAEGRKSRRVVLQHTAVSGGGCCCMGNYLCPPAAPQRCDRPQVQQRETHNQKLSLLLRQARLPATTVGSNSIDVAYVGR